MEFITGVFSIVRDCNKVCGFVRLDGVVIRFVFLGRKSSPAGERQGRVVQIYLRVFLGFSNFLHKQLWKIYINIDPCHG